MTFAFPALLWALAAILPLVAIYFLKVRPRRRATTAFFLWQQVIQERRSNKLFHRLRDFLSLALMAAAIAAIAFALAEPQWRAAERKDLLIIVDNSASMQAVEGRSTRLELAKQRAAEIVRALDGVQRAAVATVGHELEYRSHLSDNPRTLLAAIDKIEATAETMRPESLPAGQSILDAPASSPEASSTATDSQAASISAASEASPDEKPAALKSPESATPQKASPQIESWRTSYRVLLISDGAIPAEMIPSGIELMKVGGEVENFGLVAADAGYFPHDARRLTLYFQLASTAAEPREFDLLLSHELDGQWQLAKVIPVRIEPGVNPPQVFSFDDMSPGRWQAVLDVKDALTSDNKAYLVARKPPPIRTSVAAENRFFFEQSVLAFAGESDLLALVDKNPEIVLAAGVAPAVPRTILFQPSGESPWWSELGETVEVAAPRVLVEGHPVLAHIDASTINFAGARTLVPLMGSQVLLASENDVPLIYIAHRAGQAALVVNMDPIAAEFYFSAWFPVLVRSAALHLAGREEPLAATYAPRSIVPVPGAAPESVATVTLPDGQETEVRGAHFYGAREVGFYEMKTAAGAWPVACSQLSSQETLLNGTAHADTALPIERGSMPAAQLTILALVLIVGESLLYHRRKVG